MTEFLVTIDVRGVFALPEGEREDVVRRERAAGRKLLDSGTIRHFWRTPGKPGNVGVWVAPSVDELHEVLRELPIYPYVTMDVVGLEPHSLTVGR
ncbi:muconolactone Delta-isomerase [Nocardia terpenica]|uniref:Muconolactone delta-isomerase n=1 Tax=Nocardia terpenica TaxID=455432 RepID=A0A291RDG4_9NOCA|nr:muconolactone Delta-isomerase family protein [Nocardia terpenica]ATL65377.1 muconolactone delta-isomerase [Nocardia terpenica]